MSRNAPPTKLKESRSAAVRAALARPPKRQLSRWQRERRQRLLIFGLAAGLLAFIAIILGFGYVREILVRPNEPAAIVGDQMISIGQLVQRVRPQLVAIDNELMRLQAQAPTSTSPTATDTTARQFQMLQGQRMNAADQVLTDMIEEELIRLEAEKRGIVVSNQELDDRINTDLARQHAVFAEAQAQSRNPVPTPDTVAAPGPTGTPTRVPTLTADTFQTAYQDFLSRINYTDAQYRAYVESLLLREKLRDALSADVPRTQDHVHARRLIVATQEEATAALAQIRTGERTLDDLAREKSIDLTSKSAGGDLGWLPRGIESPQFDDAAFRLTVGEYSEPIVTPQGWEIIQLVGREARPLSEDHLDRMKGKAFDQWLRDVQSGPTVRRELNRERRDWVMRQAGGSRPSSSGAGGRPTGF